MKAFIRFETDWRCAHSRRLLGAFRAAECLEEQADLPASTAELLRETLDWFNRHLIVPKYCWVKCRGQFWFRSEARDVVGRMWDLAAILRDEGVHVAMRHTRQPGRLCTKIINKSPRSRRASGRVAKPYECDGQHGRLRTC